MVCMISIMPKICHKRLCFHHNSLLGGDLNWRISCIESLANFQTVCIWEELQETCKPLDVGQHARLDEVFVAAKVLERSGEVVPGRARHHLPAQKKNSLLMLD